ncbi:MAG: hypothetical protein ACI4V3_06210 [Faecousia sp.]
MVRRARPLGVPTAKRQTAQTNKLLRTWWFLHAAGHVTRPTGERMATTRAGSLYEVGSSYGEGCVRF